MSSTACSCIGHFDSSAPRDGWWYWVIQMVDPACASHGDAAILRGLSGSGTVES